MDQIEHTVRDANYAGEKQSWLITTDRHGLTIEMKDGKVVTLDLSCGVVNIYEKDHNPCVHTVYFPTPIT